MQGWKELRPFFFLGERDAMTWILRILGAVLITFAVICFLYARHEHGHAVAAAQEAEHSGENERRAKIFRDGAEASRENVLIGIVAGTISVVIGGGMIVVPVLRKKQGQPTG
jgi:hypothetical protein